MVLPCHILCHQICFWSIFESLQLLQPVCDIHTSPSVSRQNRRCSSLTSQFKNKGKCFLSGYLTNTFVFLVHKSKSLKNYIKSLQTYFNILVWSFFQTNHILKKTSDHQSHFLDYSQLMADVQNIYQITLPVCL